jgi:hypothetical protein
MSIILISKFFVLLASEIFENYSFEESMHIVVENKIWGHTVFFADSWCSMSTACALKVMLLITLVSSFYHPKIDVTFKSPLDRNLIVILS